MNVLEPYLEQQCKAYPLCHVFYLMYIQREKDELIFDHKITVTSSLSTKYTTFFVSLLPTCNVICQKIFQSIDTTTGL